MKHDKLVRDKIPEIIQKGGKKPVTHIAGEVEYAQRLREKLKEESTEFYVSGKDEELADVLEVVHAICDVKGMSMQELEGLRKKKADERGSFSKRIILDEVQ